MITIRQLESIDRGTLERIMPGYTSVHRYAVSKSETPERTVITLQLVALEKPYARIWKEESEAESRAEIERYQQVVGGRHSLAAYDDDRLVGLAIAEPDWNGALWV